MNFIEYIKKSRFVIYYSCSIFLIINIILFASAPLDKTIIDILYLNLLMLVLSIISLIIGYIRWKDKYKDFYNALEKEDDIDLILKEEDFNTELIQKVIKLKNKQCLRNNKHLKNSLDELNEYITKWVHEIKIPISVCELIVDKLEEIENSNMANELRTEIERIKFLIEQVLYASRSVDYSNDLTMSDINLDSLIKKVVRKNALLFISKNIEVELKNLNFNVITDEKWLFYAVDQLLNNASKYTNKNGKVEIYAKEYNKITQLIIKDNGIGIMQKDINRIFDKGFTGDNGRKFTKSTGMGLYFVNKMLKKLNHKITVNSEVSKYTEFCINFSRLDSYPLDN